MAIKTINYQVLDVGQGTGNFIETYDTSNNLISAIIIDFGSEKEIETAGKASAKWIADRLNSMAAPTLEAIFFSHSDSDHINLIEYLLAYFNVPGQTRDLAKKDLVINNVYYGGPFAKYVKRGTNILNLLKAYTPDAKVIPMGTHYSSYKEPLDETVPFLSAAGVDIYVLAVNVPKSYVSDPSRSISGANNFDSFALNTMSMVLVVHIGDQSYLATGDATGTTLAFCNTVMDRFGTEFNQRQLKGSLKMLTMPHHGSEVTMFNLTGTKRGRDDEPAEMNLEKFVDHIQPLSFTASAERKRRFYHPSAFLFQFFWKYLDPTPFYCDKGLASSKRHYYIAYFKKADNYKLSKGQTNEPWPASLNDGWYTVQTEANIYTNLYYDPESSGTRHSFGINLESDMVVMPGIDTHTGKPVLQGSLTAKPEAPLPPLGMSWEYSYTVSTKKTGLNGRSNRDNTVVNNAAASSATATVKEPAKRYKQAAAPSSLSSLSSLRVIT